MKRILPLLFEILKRIWKFLTEPLELLPGIGDYRRSVITSAFLLFAAIAVAIEQLLAGNTPLSALLLLIAGYVLARTRGYKYAALILVITLTFPSYLVALRLPNPDPNRIISAFAWVIMPLLLSSLIYSVRATVIISIINFLALAALPFIRPELDYRAMGGAMGLFGLTSIILIIVMVQRNQIEADRQKELVESHNELAEEASKRELFAEQAQHRADQLVMLNEINHAISSVEGLDFIFNAVFEHAKRQFQPDVFYIGLHDEKTEFITFPIMYDNSKLWDQAPTPLSKAPRVRSVIHTRKPILLNPTQTEIEAFQISEYHLGDQSRTAASIIITPLFTGNRVVGVISVQSYLPGRYTADDLMLLTAIGQQVAIAIENARLYEQTIKRAQRLTILNEVGREISTLSNLPALLENVYQQVQKALSADLFFIGLCSKNKTEITFPIMYDNGRLWEQAPGKLTTESFSGQAILTRQPLLINEWSNTVSESEASPTILGDDTKITRSLMYAPMLFGKDTIGVISVQSYKANAYAEEDLNLLSGIANQVSIAIENSRLYSAAQQEITERQKIEAQLRTAEAKYRELVEHIPAVVYNSEPGATGRWFYVSPRIETLLGYTSAEWLADPDLWYQQIHPEDREYVITTEAQAIANGTRVEMEYRMYTKAGNLLWIHDESLNISNSENQQFIVQGFLMDITIRKQAELTLKDSEEKYHSLFITAERQARELSLLSEVQVALARELDLPILIRTVVEAIAKTFGYTFVSLYKLDNGFLHLQHQVGYENVIEKISPKEGVSGRVINTGQSVLIKDAALETGFLRADPNIKSEVCVPLFNGDEIFGILNVESAHDYQLTEDDLRLMNSLSEQINIAIRRARLYTERAESLRREQHINEFAHAINSTLDLPSILEIVARLCVELIGADTGTVSLISDDGMEMTDVYSYNEVPILEQLIPRGQGLTWLTYEKGRPVISDEYSQHPNAMPAWAASGLHAYMAVPIMAGQKSLGALTLYNRTTDKKFTQRDLSLIEAIAQEVAIAIQNARLFDALQKELAEHKQTQDQLQVLVHELEAKNAELERFTYSVSHDLKSPLVTIGGFLGFLEADIKKGETQRIENTIHRIREAAKKMHRLLDELLELSRIGRLINPPAEVPFGELVSEALELAHGQLTARQVEVQVEAELPIVSVDRVRMVEVLQNLIVNATKFMGKEENPVIEIGAQIKSDEQIFFVKDNGIGIAPEYHHKVFGLFDKLDAHSDGTGIGLALVKRIVEVHGGTIWIESEVGKGATFFFTLEHKKQQENL